MSSVQSSAVQRFCRLPTPSYETIYADANTILDDIISHCHTYRRPNTDLSAEEIVSFVSHGCTMLSNASILLKSKFAQVVNVYLPLMKSAIDEVCVNHLVFFLCQPLQNTKSSLVAEFLKALTFTLTGNGVYVNDENIVLLLGEEGVVWAYLGQTDWILKSYAIQCLGNICLRSLHVGVVGKDNIRLCYSKLLDVLRLLSFDDSNEIEHFKLINVALKALQKVLSGVTMHDNVVEPEFAVMLLKIFLVYGNPGYQVSVNRVKARLPSRKSDDLEAIEKIYPTRKKEKSAMTKKVNARKSRKKKKKNMSTSYEDAYEVAAESDPFSSGILHNWRQMPGQSSSESEYSDSETNQTEQMNAVMAKIRYNCAVTLQEILRCCDRRSRFACWLTLIPDSLSNDEPSLLQSFVAETSEKINTAILLAIMELTDGSKGFLDSVMTVQNCSSSTFGANRAFTPYSVKLNQSLHILHDQFIESIGKEQSELLKEKMIKCLTLLCLNTPYKKLSKNYLPMIMQLVSSSLDASESSLRQATLTCLAASISIDSENKEVFKLLSTNIIPSNSHSKKPVKDKCKKQPTDDTDKIKPADEGSSWLVAHCLQRMNSAGRDNARELRLSSEYIQLMTVVLRTHPQLIKKNETNEVISLCMNVFMFSPDISISFHAIKLLEEFAKYYNRIYETTKEDEEGSVFWRKMLTAAIPHYLHDKPPKPVKGQAAICDWISNIGSHMFAILKNSEQIFVKTVLIGLTENGEPLIAAASVRALGAIVDYDSMKDDVWFVVDATRSILKQLNNPALSVRLKAAWSLANLCDFIAKNEFLAKEYPESLILNLLQDATKAALNNEKISPNGVRAIGNLLKSFQTKLYESEKFVGPIEEAVKALIKNISTDTLECLLCLQIYLRKRKLPDRKGGMDSKSVVLSNQEVSMAPLFSALLEALRDCKNFKVRISAAIALSSLKSRQCYGDIDTFSNVWNESLSALEKSEELTDFTEFKHKENLQEQTTNLLLHLLSIASSKDLEKLQREVVNYNEVFLAHCQKFVSRVEGDDEKVVSVAVDPDGYMPEPAVLSENEVQKRQNTEKQLERLKENLLNVEHMDKNQPTIELIKSSLGLVT